MFPSRPRTTLAALTTALALLGVPLVALGALAPLLLGTLGGSVPTSAAANSGTIATVEAPNEPATLSTGTTSGSEPRAGQRDLPAAVEVEPAPLPAPPPAPDWPTPPSTVTASSADLAPIPVERGPPHRVS